MSALKAAFSTRQSLDLGAEGGVVVQKARSIPCAHHLRKFSALKSAIRSMFRTVTDALNLLPN
jgi:hypothetical protein